MSSSNDTGKDTEAKCTSVTLTVGKIFLIKATLKKKMSKIQRWG